MLVFFIAACGSDDDGGTHMEPLPEPALDKSKLLNQLTADEEATLCDWGVSQFGGYGARPRCDNGVAIRVADSRADCTSHSWDDSCTATVGDLEECNYATVADPCTNTVLASDACSAVLACEI